MPSPDFLLHHTRVTAEGASPSRWMLVLHGILGSGLNFKTIARKLAESCPTWGFLLVDLRGHGLSQSPPPPNTINAAAMDLVRLSRSLNLPVSGVMGHSFGGKVTIAYLGLRPGELTQAWVLDAGPSATPEARSRGETIAILRMLDEMPMPLPSRERFLEIVAEKGHSRAIAAWLAMNVKRAEDGYRLRIELPTIREMLSDYVTQDLWPILEKPGIAQEVHIVLGGRSTSVPADDKARYHELSRRTGSVHVHVLPQAGHWVHADDPEALLDLMRPALAL